MKREFFIVVQFNFLNFNLENIRPAQSVKRHTQQPTPEDCQVMNNCLLGSRLILNDLPVDQSRSTS